MVENFTISIVSSSSVRASWAPVKNPYLSQYTVYYYPRTGQSSNEQTAVFLAGNSSGIIQELEDGQTYLFTITATYNINGQNIEGNRSEVVLQGEW